MSHLLDVFGPGDRFLTESSDGRVLVWVVAPTGLVRILPGSLPRQDDDTQPWGWDTEDKGPAK